MTSPKSKTNADSKRKQGYVPLWRCVREHWLYQEQRVFSRWEAFEWLMLEASFKPREVMVQLKPHQLDVGQLITTYRTLAEKWGWSVRKVELFLGVLIADQTLVTENVGRATKITLCNYSKWRPDLYFCETIERRSEDDQKTGTVPASNTVIVTLKKNTIKNDSEALEGPQHTHTPPAPCQKDNLLVPISVDDDGHVKLTEVEVERLEKKLGFEKLNYLIQSASDFAKSQPAKWAKYKDHAAFLRNQDRFHAQKGHVFFQHPDTGWGYYPQWVAAKHGASK